MVRLSKCARCGSVSFSISGSSLLWVVFLAIIFLYLFAMIAFLFFRDIFAEDVMWCHTLYECFMTVMRDGLVLQLHQVWVFAYPSRLYLHQGSALLGVLPEEHQRPLQLPDLPVEGHLRSGLLRFDHYDWTKYCSGYHRGHVFGVEER